MLGEETRQVFKVFGAVVTQREDALECQAAREDIATGDRDAVDRLRAAMALVDRPRSRRIA